MKNARRNARTRERALAAVLGVLCLPAMAFAAQPLNPFLIQAEENFDELDYEQCLLRLNQAAEQKNTSTDSAQIEMYFGLCHFHLGHEREAAEHFRMARRLDPSVQMPADVGPKVKTFFTSAISTFPADAPLSPTSVPPTDAAPSVAKTVEEPPPTVRRSVVPWVLAGGATVALGLGVGFGLHARGLERQANGAAFRSDANRFAADATRFATLTNVSYAVAGATAITAAVVYILSRD